MRWTRKFYRLTFITGVIAAISALANGETLFWILAALLLLTWGIGSTVITMQIRKAERERR